MQRYNGSSNVRGGYYFNLDTWNIATVSGEEGVLDGSTDDRYVRLPLVLMVPVALAASFLFVVFLPAIGFVLLAYAIARALGVASAAGVKRAAVTVSPGWEPGAAHLAGKPQPSETASAAESDDGLVDLKKEIDARRAEKPEHE